MYVLCKTCSSKLKEDKSWAKIIIISTYAKAGITQVNMDKVNWYCVHAADPHTPKKQQWLAEKERCVWGLCPQPPLTHPSQSGCHSLLWQFSIMLKQLLCGGQVSLRVWNSWRENGSCLRGASLSSAEQATVTTWSFLSTVSFSSFPIAQFRA